MQLTSSETRAIEQGKVISIAVDQMECVILRKDVFDRVQHLIYDDSDLTQEETESLLAMIGREAGWAHAQMDVYDNYDEERAKQCP